MWDVLNERALLIREPHEVRILRLVRDSGQISRIEIAKLCNLDKSYVGDLVAKLIQAGFLEETGKVETGEKVGRKRTLLRFRPLAGLVAGVDIGMTHATVALTDLNAKILQQESFQYPLETSAKEVISRVALAIHTLLAAANISQSKLVGIGIGVQGIVDYATNTLLLSHNKKAWQGESLSEALEAWFNVPVYVENDVKTMTIGEYMFGAAKGTKTSVNIWIGDGLGAGMMINGHLHRGVTSSAGEIGYNELEASSFYREKYPLTYKDQAMLGEILTDANFIESYRRNSPPLNDIETTVVAIVQKSKIGDLVAQRVIEEFTSLLSTLSIIVVNMLNPEIIIIGGKLVQSLPKVAEMLQEKIHMDLLSVPAEAVRVRAAQHGENGVVLGAAGLVLYELFEPLHSLSLRATRRHANIKFRAADIL
jgi:predicted NBD/HSP70 family sugar kinase